MTKKNKSKVYLWWSLGSCALIGIIILLVWFISPSSSGVDTIFVTDPETGEVTAFPVDEDGNLAGEASLILGDKYGAIAGRGFKPPRLAKIETCSCTLYCSDTMGPWCHCRGPPGRCSCSC